MKKPTTKEYIWLGLGTGFVVVAVVGIFVYAKRKADSSIDWSKFDSPDAKGSGRCMDKQLISMLKKLQRKTRLPIFRLINSGARTAFWNSKVGGVKNSAHLIPVCKAVDIKTQNKVVQQRVVLAAKEVGFKRIGIGSNFVHLDVDSSKPQYAVWGYPSGTPPPFNPF